jgi:hypothetical protein
MFISFERAFADRISPTQLRDVAKWHRSRRHSRNLAIAENLIAVAEQLERNAA